jgi:hypothetical protein
MHKLENSHTGVTMKKLLLTATALLLSLGAFAQQAEILLDELIIIKRTSATPKKVTIKYSFNYMEKQCVAYKVKVDKLKEFNQMVCDKNADGSHECSEVEYKGLYNAETVCTKNGLIRKTKETEITLNFKSAVKLAEGAEETFQVGLKQKKSTSDDTEKAAQTMGAASLYKISTFFNTIKFKAQ